MRASRLPRDWPYRWDTYLNQSGHTRAVQQPGELGLARTPWPTVMSSAAMHCATRAKARHPLPSPQPGIGSGSRGQLRALAPSTAACSVNR